jgi:hypothetical protein
MDLADPAGEAGPIPKQENKGLYLVPLGLQDTYAITQRALLPPGHENELLLCMSSA